MKKVGYQARDAGTHRTYSFSASVKRYKKTGKFLNRKDGSGHLAGERWGEDKQINPESTVTKYSKNSPSFDEGVYKYKSLQRAKKQLMAEKM